MEELKSVAFIASILINYLRVCFFAEIDSLCIFLFAESQLNSFVQMKDAWKMCLYFITHTHNEYVMMYAMNVLEVKKKKKEGKKLLWFDINSAFSLLCTIFWCIYSLSCSVSVPWYVIFIFYIFFKQLFFPLGKAQQLQEQCCPFLPVCTVFVYVWMPLFGCSGNVCRCWVV